MPPYFLRVDHDECCGVSWGTNLATALVFATLGAEKLRNDASTAAIPSRRFRPRRGVGITSVSLQCEISREHTWTSSSTYLGFHLIRYKTLA